MTSTTRPIASYRLQLTPELGFREAIGLLDHLVELGVSHLYVSPVAEAVPGSTHGYDVVDPTTVRAELGGDDGLVALLDALAERSLALVVDHVPNHVSTARPDLNPPWWEMLRDGPGSPGARWFDVDRRHDPRVLLAILAEPLSDMVDAGRITVADGVVVVDGGVRLPLAEGTAGLPLPELLQRQHHLLTWWRSPERNVRRFFTIDDLVAVRVEVPEVVEVVDSLPERLARHRAFGGVRIDHLDGLADPAGYLAQLRRRLGDDAWLVVEKIMAPGETLPDGWPVDGTTGYEFARLVDHLVLDPSAASLFAELWTSVSGDARDFHEVEDEARREVLAGGLRPDVERTVAAAAGAFGETDDVTALDELDAAIVELTVQLPRYRTYLPDDPAGRSVLEASGNAAIAARPAVAGTIERVVQTLLEPATESEERFRTRWQQLTGPAMAKGAEDRAFYRYLRLASVCEVGGDPGSFGVTVDEFHQHNIEVAARWPQAMLAASTHDTKRSDAIRARSAALTQLAGEWTSLAERWSGELVAVVPGLPGATALLALQTVVTTPGLDGPRLAAYLVKAAREADLHTSWTDPDAGHEARLQDAAAALTGGSTLSEEVAVWSERLDVPGRRVLLAATALRMTAPGVPDIYQGTEVPSFRLVDPDNRVPPETETLHSTVSAATLLDGPTAVIDHPDAAIAVVIVRSLALRRRRPESFGAQGGYRPLEPVGPRAGSFVIFGRGDDVVVVVALDGRGRASGSDVTAGETTLELPPGRWRDVFDDAFGDVFGEVSEEGADGVAGRLLLDRLLVGFPAMLLERVG